MAVGEPILDPLGVAFSRGFMDGYEEYQRQKDLETLMGAFQGPSQDEQAATGAGIGGPTDGAISGGGMPLSQTPNLSGMQMGSEMGQNLLGQYIQSLMQSRMPVSPLDQARIQGALAGAERDTAYAEHLRRQPMEFEPTDPRFYIQQGYSQEDAMRAARVKADLELGAQAQVNAEMNPLRRKKLEGEIATLDVELAQLKEDAQAKMSPKERADLARTEKQLKELAVKQAQANIEMDPLRRKKLEAEIATFGKESPTQKWTRKKLEALDAMEPGSAEYHRALGFDSRVDIPEAEQQDVTDALALIASGENPIDVYQSLLGSNPRLRRYAPAIKGMLIPTSTDLLDMLLEDYLTSTGTK